MFYDIKCSKCDYTDTWVCSVSQYTERLKQKCPSCKKKGGVYQSMTDFNFILKGEGWTLKGKGVKGAGSYKPGSQEDLDDALRENDLLEEKSEKDDNWKRAREEGDNKRAKEEIKALQDTRIDLS